MNDILIKINEAIKNYYNKYERHPNAVLINEKDLNLLRSSLSPFLMETKALGKKAVYEVYDLKIIPIKYGEIQAVEEVSL